MFPNFTKLKQSAKKTKPEKKIWGLLPLSKNIKIGHVNIIKRIKYFDEKKFFLLKSFNIIPDIEIIDVNWTSDPNCSDPTEKPIDIKTSPIPACNPVNHSGKSVYLLNLKIFNATPAW